MAVKGWGLLVTAFKEGGQLIKDEAKDIMLTALPMLDVIGKDYRKEVAISVKFMQKQSKILGPLMRDLGWFGGKGTTVSAGIASGLYASAVGEGPLPEGADAAREKTTEKIKKEEKKRTKNFILEQRKREAA